MFVAADDLTVLAAHVQDGSDAGAAEVDRLSTMAGDFQGLTQAAKG